MRNSILVEFQLRYFKTCTSYYKQIEYNKESGV